MKPGTTSRPYNTKLGELKPRNGDRLNKLQYSKLGELKPNEGESSRQAPIMEPWRTEALQQGSINSPQANTTYPNRHMHARKAREEKQHAPRHADEGAVAPATGL